MFNFIQVISLAIALLVPVKGVLSVPLAVPRAASRNAPSPSSVNAVTANPVGNVAAVQRPSDGETRLFFQEPDTDVITEYSVSGSFDTGHLEIITKPFATDSVKQGTSVAAAALPDLSEIHVFFFSTENILNEYYWDGSGWNGGANCQLCINSGNFVGVGTGEVLYAMQNPDTRQLRVGFVGADSSTTITEAIREGDGENWGLFPLVN